jgi:anti-sigma factor (TIGR02949 family)
VTPIDAETCAVIFAMLDDFLDRELNEEDVARVERHLVTCAMCASEFRFEDHLLVRLRAKVQRIAAPPDLHARVWRGVVRHAREGGNLPGVSAIERDDDGTSG